MKGLRLCLLLHRRDTETKKPHQKVGFFSGPKWDKALNPDGL